MKRLNKGEFFGDHYNKLVAGNIIITDTEYTHEKVDWHYHENPYFTYLLNGKLFESNKKESYYLKPGSLLFHNWQDAHYNIKPKDFTRGFHVELNRYWFDKHKINLSHFEGSFHVPSPLVKNLMNTVFIESKINDLHSKVTIEMALVNIFSNINSSQYKAYKNPNWVKTLNELLIEERGSYSLQSLSQQIGIHPNHLSREFSKYFGTTLGAYVRLIKLNKAFYLLSSSKMTLTEICYECGFYDQSHFTSSFKLIYQMTPSSFLKKIS